MELATIATVLLPELMAQLATVVLFLSAGFVASTAVLENLTHKYLIGYCGALGIHNITEKLPFFGSNAPWHSESGSQKLQA